FESDVLQGREAKFISIEKVADLGIEIKEENGGIYVTSIKEGGALSENGNIEVGDQLLNVEGTSLIGISREQAQEELREAMNRRAVSSQHL
ncbi:synaptojanin-2-binding protein-like, partial [Actinia tenebrosa]|uniref:Synaptojanin-2-binding protein-like n=1 Tax=Actinia tenebrosa TaxID=6105 RepID=A0A6P8HZF0_ACTTE